MNPETVLQIILMSLNITHEVIKGIPIESRQEMWRQHEKNLEFWTNLFDRLQPKPKS